MYRDEPYQFRNFIDKSLPFRITRKTANSRNGEPTKYKEYKARNYTILANECRLRRIKAIERYKAMKELVEKGEIPFSAISKMRFYALEKKGVNIEDPTFINKF